MGSIEVGGSKETHEIMWKDLHVHLCSSGDLPSWISGSEVHLHPKPFRRV